MSQPNESKQEDMAGKTPNRTELFLKHHDFVRFVAMLNAPAFDLIDDIVNDVFIVFMNEKHEWDLTADVRPLLRKIAVNVSHEYWRKKVESLPQGIARLTEYVRQNTSLMDSEEEKEGFEEEFSALNICLYRLPERSRQIIMEHYVQGTPLVQIAKQTHRNASVLYNIISRARTSLGQCIEKLLGRLGHAR